ncbi:hypothetical protein C9374_009966 [Naegleria lovaniensis]|uniref:C2 domain-containing protein n=1 Tax=Naegleria lovaniensis TaxID=51637 RepID=A0AA88GI52_NAELO|nr:uncharacterized protein C9374_009966 [Naegleria lovaniensis]KAG2375343.1 hypothetical protein C9374_009966 [Naegleria lovaniensis]
MVFNSVRGSVELYRPSHHHAYSNSNGMMVQPPFMLPHHDWINDHQNSSGNGNHMEEESFNMIGRIWIKLVEARRLIAADVNGKSDPYCVLMVENIQQKSRVIYQNLDPIWNEEFCFDLTDTKQELVVYVMDEDTIGTDDFLGFVEIPIHAIVDSKTDITDKWYKLKSKSLTHKVTGEIHLQLKFLSKNILLSNSAFSPLSNNSSDMNNYANTMWGSAEDNEIQSSLGDIFSVERMIKDIHSAGYLHSFMKDELCEESLEFIYAVNQYRKVYKQIVSRMDKSTPFNTLVDDKLRDLKHMATSIYERFIRPYGPQEINLPWEIRENLQELFEKKISQTMSSSLSSLVTLDIFNQAHSYILNMIQNDVFPRFLCSVHFTNWSYSLDWAIKFKIMMEEKRKKQSLSYLVELMDEKSLNFLKKRIAQREKKSKFQNTVRDATNNAESDEEGVLDDLNLSEYHTSKYLSEPSHTVTTSLVESNQ